jgi:CRP/FNR family transcriptional regulator, cyclic AMP receptor protein
MERQTRRKIRSFDVKAFLNAPGVTTKVVDYGPGTVIYSQGDESDTVLYIQQGTVKLSVVSKIGKEAVVGMLGGGDFFGEGALAGQPLRLATAASVTSCRILLVPKRQMIRLLHQQHAFSDRFIAHMLARNSRLEEDLVDQLFNASEKRLARTLLLLARYGRPNGPRRVVPKISQEVLAEIVGTTRSRINFFMNKFRKLGFIDYNGTLKVHDALLSVVLHDSPPSRRDAEPAG